FNFIPYREIGLSTAKYLEKTYQMPFISDCPIGVTQIAKVIKAIEKILFDYGYKKSFNKYIQNQTRFMCQ
ncbi:MAG: ferredoxin:protochlorophyllide reductase (ATP-dependent) subunit B, partial [Bacteroidota bacterium]